MILRRSQRGIPSAKFTALHAVHSMHSALEHMTRQCLDEMQLRGVPGNCTDLAIAAASTPTSYPRIMVPGVNITFCVACYKRSWQLRCAVLANILALWPRRTCVKLVVTIFEDDVGGSAPRTQDAGGSAPQTESEKDIRT